MSKTEKIVNMLADDTAAPAAARTLAEAAEQEGKLIAEYLIERLHSDYAQPVTAWDNNKTAATAGGEKRQGNGNSCRQNRRRPTRSPGRQSRWFWLTGTRSSSLTA